MNKLKKNNKAPLLYNIMLCASFQIHWWIQTGVTVRKTLDSGQNVCATFWSHQWTQTSGTVQKHWILVKIGNFFVLCDLQICQMILKEIERIFYDASRLMNHFIAISEFKLEFKIEDFLVSWDLQIWQMRLKNNRTPPFCYFRLCASFRSHWWIQAGVTVRKHPIWVKKMMIFLAVWPWNLTDDLEKQ